MVDVRSRRQRGIVLMMRTLIEMVLSMHQVKTDMLEGGHTLPLMTVAVTVIQTAILVITDMKKQKKVGCDSTEKC